MKPLFAFGPFRLDPGSRRLLREGRPVALPPKAFDVLLALVEQRGQLIEKDELLRLVWPDVTVEEGNLTQHVFTLRKILGEEPGGAQYVATIPRRGYQFVADVLELPHASPRTTSTTMARPQKTTKTTTADDDSPVGKSLAVLPFAPLGPDEADRVLGFGMADALIMRLGNIRQAIVRPTSAVRRYLGVAADPVAAGRELLVDLVLEGSLQRCDERIRVTVQLVSVSEGVSLWGARFDEKMTDIFAMQDSIAERLAAALVPRLTEDEHRRVTMHDTSDVEAHQMCLEGRYYLGRRTDEALRKAIEQFERAIARDPNYALAYAGLADCHTILSSAGYDAQAHQAIESARAAAVKAVEIDDGLAEAHTALALVRFRLDWRWLDAEVEFTRAIELNPGSAAAHHFFALYLAAMGRSVEALSAIRRALALDPLSLIINAAAGRILHFARAYAEAIERYVKTLELDADFPDAHMNLGMSYLEVGRADEAVRELHRAADLSGRRWLMLALLGYAYAISGQEHEARRTIEELKPAAERGEVSPMLLTYPYAGLGESELALDWLERSFEEHSGLLIYLKVEPMFDRLRGDPRFTTLMRRLRLAY